MAAIEKISLEFFKQGFIPGMTVYVKTGDNTKNTVVETAVIKETYPHIALTDKGTFQWVQLYMWNNGKIQPQ